jgi:opacity protein-like surface antigen
MTKTALTHLALITALCTSVMAGPDSPSLKETTAPTISLYNAKEWQLDLAGSFSFSARGDRRLIDGHGWGGGGALNYFFTRNFGLGVEGSAFDGNKATLGSAALNLYYRLPIGESPVALYGFGGAGATFNADHIAADNLSDKADHVVFEGHAGVGLEYRFTPNVGCFSDVRYTLENTDDSNFATARVGVRFVF